MVLSCIKNVSRLLRAITSNHNGDSYCLNCLIFIHNKKTLKKHERTCTDHDLCYVKMPNENNRILKYNPGEK